MPHFTLKLVPGADFQKTPALNEAAISECQLIRFFPDRNGLGLVQKLGGWTRFYLNQAPAPIRALWAWEDTNAVQWLAYGAQNSPTTLSGQLEVIRSGAGRDITPRTFVDNPAVNFSTVSTSNTVAVVDPINSTTSYDSCYIATHVSVGGLVLFGFYPITNVSATAYDIFALDLLGYPAFATSTVNNGGAVASFTAVSGSALVTVVLNNHGYLVGSTYPVLVSTTVGGVTLFGNYLVASITDANTFTIVGQQAATSDVTASINGGNVRIVYYVGQGPASLGAGYGVGGYGSGGYGGSFVVTAGPQGAPISALDWTLDNFGQILLACAVSQPNTLTTNWASGTGSVATVGFSQAFTVEPGLIVNVSGVTPSGFNGAQTVTGWTTATLTGTGTVATATFNSSYVNPVGSTIVVFGAIPTGFNGTFTVTASSAGSVSWASAATGPQTGAGTLYSNTAIAFPSSATGPQTVAGTISVPDVDYAPIYYWDPTSGLPFAQILPNCPFVNDGMFVAMPQRQIIAWGSSSTGIQDPLLLRWCDVNNPTVWTATVTNQAGQYRIPKGSKIVTCLQGPQQALIFTDLSVWAMQYINLPNVYGFNEIATGCGAIGRKAAGVLGPTVFWMSQSQFFKLDGNGVQTIPCPVWDVVFQQLDTNNLNKIRFAPNARFGEVAWYYPIVGGTGEPTNYVKYNVNIGQWDYGTLDRTAWIDQSVLGPPIGAATDNYIYQHETSNDANGQAMTSYFQTGYAVLNEADLKIFIDQVWPDMKWGDFNSPPTANITLTFYVADYPGDTPLVYGPFSLTEATEYITPRFRGRLVSIRIGSSDVGSFWRVGAMRYRGQQDGKF